MHVTFRQLKVFEAVARHLSYTRAADELHLTQPAVSMQVKQLEDSIGLPLFDKLGKKIFLTEAGHELQRYSRSISQQLAEAETVLEDLKGGQRGQLKLTVLATANYFMPEFLAKFGRKYPHIRIILDVTNRAGALHQLRNNETDVAIMGQPPDDLELDSTSFRKNPLVVVAPIDHPLVTKRTISLKQLEQETFLAREPGSETRAVMERFFKRHKIDITIDTELGSNEAIKQSIRAGLGLGLLSLDTLSMEMKLKQLAVLNVEKFPIMLHWNIVSRQDKRLPKIAQSFKQFLTE